LNRQLALIILERGFTQKAVKKISVKFDRLWKNESC
jgi:hypothetical protein